MSIHKEFISLFTTKKEICIAYEQDDMGTNYVDIPICDIISEFTNSDLRMFTKSKLIRHAEQQEKKIIRLQNKIYNLRINK